MSTPRLPWDDDAQAEDLPSQVPPVLVAPVAPLMGAIGIRIQGITLWLRRVPVVPRTDSSKAPRTKSRDRERVDQS